ncbi:hypothetical protein [Legionella drancourtii]|uniref:Uncharacterized protein n=1 Tax=Legionella drancourtii LLAP12 TaxID=658187 RepID=G9ERF6_9GAMM|nr:hypothetical protein [Legionella drancourtii]EHL30125.1 hypothetical protein LDG_7870 [Legionella drancourtii LLAP12]
MSELITYNQYRFNKRFLKLRTQYYIYETRELLARHKLLMAFIICLLVPGIENLRAVGMPFYVIIAPTVSLKMKLLCLTIGLGNPPEK